MFARYLVVMVKVRVRGYGMHYAKEGPHKAGSSLLYVCAYVCVTNTRGWTQKAEDGKFWVRYLIRQKCSIFNKGFEKHVGKMVCLPLHHLYVICSE